MSQFLIFILIAGTHLSYLMEQKPVTQINSKAQISTTVSESSKETTNDKPIMHEINTVINVSIQTSLLTIIDHLG